VLRRLQEAWDARLLRLKNPYVLDVVRGLAPHPRGLRSMILLDRLRSTRMSMGLPIPRTFDASVQAAVNYHCRDSDVFKDRDAPDSEALFCWPQGKGKGIWAIIADNTRLWVRTHLDQLLNRILKE
jgi:hypothetical protein